jgi:hypothetical protein
MTAGQFTAPLLPPDQQLLTISPAPTAASPWRCFMTCSVCETRTYERTEKTERVSTAADRSIAGRRVRGQQGHAAFRPPVYRRRPLLDPFIERKLPGSAQLRCLHKHCGRSVSSEYPSSPKSSSQSGDGRLGGKALEPHLYSRKLSMLSCNVIPRL